MIRNLKVILIKYYKLMGAKSLIFIVSWICAYICFQSLLVLVPNHLFLMLQTSGTVLELFLYVFVLVTSNIICSVLTNKNSQYCMLYRLKEIGNLNKFILELPVCFVESESGQQKIKEAQRAVSHGNDIGLEAFLSGFIYFVGAISSVTMFIILSVKLPFWLIIIIFATPLIKIPFDIKRIKKEKVDIKGMESVWDEDDRIKRNCLNEQFGKESRLYNMIPMLEEKFNNIISKTANFNKRSIDRENKINTCYHLIMILRNIIILFAFIYSEKLSIEKNNFVLYLNIILNLSRLLDECYNNFNKIKSNNIYVNDYLHLLESEKYDKNCGGVSMPKPPYIIKFDHVSFSYNNNDSKIILDDLNFTIKSNDKIAIVGKNGSGKTTLVKLLCGFYYPTKGTITINGIDIRQMDKKSLYNELSIAFQKPMVFAMNIAENIACSTIDHIDNEKIKKIINESNLNSSINKLPKKELTNLTHWLDDEGVLLSGGQVQRLMLARVFYKKSSIIILDEPTASLDAIAEGELYEKYNAYSKNKLSVFISHRLSSTKFCDYIFVLDNGKIIQTGTHKQLYNQEGLYREMYLEQVKNFNDDSSVLYMEDVVYEK